MYVCIDVRHRTREEISYRDLLWLMVQLSKERVLIFCTGFGNSVQNCTVPESRFCLKLAWKPNFYTFWKTHHHHGCESIMDVAKKFWKSHRWDFLNFINSVQLFSSNSVQKSPESYSYWISGCTVLEIRLKIGPRVWVRRKEFPHDGRSLGVLIFGETVSWWHAIWRLGNPSRIFWSVQNYKILELYRIIEKSWFFSQEMNGFRWAFQNFLWYDPGPSRDVPSVLLGFPWNFEFLYRKNYEQTVQK